MTFNNCKNNHRFSNILFKEFEQFQKINESKIKCNKCDDNKGETNDNKFYKCCDSILIYALYITKVMEKMKAKNT